MMQDATGNSCAIGALYAGATRFAGSRRALVHFDVASAIPVGSTIHSVELRTTVLRAGSSASATDVYDLHRVQADWGESSGAGASTCFGGSGAPAATSDATWSHRLWPSTPWTAGGDFAATASGSSAVPRSGSAVWLTQPGMVADVQSWLDSPAGNHGWIIIGEEAISTTAREIDSRDGTSPPELVIDYSPSATTPPEVPDGRFAPPLRVNKLSANGNDIEVSWDAALCTVNPDHHVIFGTESDFPASLGNTFSVQGAVCNLGGSSPLAWFSSPDPADLEPSSRLLWILVVTTDGNGNEGSWGRTTPSIERDGPGLNGSSGECGVLDKPLTNLCGQGF